ncbi:TIGR02391 family protein [Providencia rettgeri]
MENEQSEQKGFANLLKRVFGTFRNTTAHVPKVT